MLKENLIRPLPPTEFCRSNEHFIANFRKHGCYLCTFLPFIQPHRPLYSSNHHPLNQLASASTCSNHGDRQRRHEATKADQVPTRVQSEGGYEEGQFGSDEEVRLSPSHDQLQSLTSDRWIAGKISDILGDEDDVVIELCFNLLEGTRFVGPPKRPVHEVRPLTRLVTAGYQETSDLPHRIS